MSLDSARGTRRLGLLLAGATLALPACSRRDSTPPEPVSVNTSQPAPTVNVKFAIVVHDDTPQHTLLVCSDIETTPEKAAAAELPQGATRMDKRCSTLPRVPLTSCSLGNVTEYYYVAQFSDSYQPNCVQRGGRWGANSSNEAQEERAAQAAQGAR
ncbi:MAG TPA: hypothetical protein VH062_23195 [Polyangiaceae bacterium]|jgi:hypothetical protein|nr:hypothetical protein [Polyangiaceae bacterium]